VSLVALLGCGSDANEFMLAPTDANVVGTFNLTVSNGRVLPIIARLTVDEEWDMTSDQLVISANNTWTETSNYKVTTFQTGALSMQQTMSSGTYSIADSKINFVMTVGGTGTFIGSVTGNTLALVYNGGHFFYSR
jgi:hypothetical protein